MSIIYILGKNKTIDTFPKDYFEGKVTLGLNHQAVKFNTSLGITGHDHVIDFWNESEYPERRWIVTDPTFEGRNHLGALRRINQKVKPEVMNLEKQSDEDIFENIANALSGCHNCRYDNYWTILHLAIFWSIRQGFDKINLIGCNNTKGVSGDYTEMQNIEYAKYHTERIIELADQVGIEIIWHKEFLQDTEGLRVEGLELEGN